MKDRIAMVLKEWKGCWAFQIIVMRSIYIVLIVINRIFKALIQKWVGVFCVMGAIMEYFMSVKLQTEHRLEFLSFKRGYTGSSEVTLVKMPYC